MEQVIESTSASQVVTLEAADSPDESSTLRSGGKEGCRESNVDVEDFPQYLHSFHTDAKYHWKLRDAISKSATRFRKPGWQRNHEGSILANSDFIYEWYNRRDRSKNTSGRTSVCSSSRSRRVGTGSLMCELIPE